MISRKGRLFPEDREICADAVDSLQVKLSGLQLRRARPFGNCWLACDLWRQLGLDRFWQDRLPDGREAVGWEKVLQLLVVNRLSRSGQRTACASALVFSQRNGRVVGYRFRRS